MADDRPLDPAVESLVLAELPTGQCIDGWTTVPNGDLLVFLIERDLQQALAPFVAACGRPRLGTGETRVFAREDGRWARVAAGGWGFGPDTLIRAFEAAARAQPRPTWVAGARLCRRWLDRYARPATQAEVDELLTEMDAEPVPCPIWREMRRQFARWAEVRDFVVPRVVRAEPVAARDRPAPGASQADSGCHS